MTAHSGDSSSGDMIFPPFVPRAAQPAPSSPAPLPEPLPEPAAEAEPWVAPDAEVEPAVSDVAGVEEVPVASREEEALPWETPVAAAPEPAEDLPWLELPDEAAEPDAAAEVPDWLSWDTGVPAAAVTETPEIPPSGDVDASASAREAAGEDGLAVDGLESFDRDESAEVEPVDGLAPVGDFGAAAGDEAPAEQPAAYETPVWAQPTEEWAAPPTGGEDPLLTSPVPAPVADADAVAPHDEGDGDAADDAFVSALDAEVAALLDAPTAPAVETARHAADVEPDAEGAPVAAEVPSAVAASPAHGDDRLSAMLDEVAGRLEAIARSLRERSPAEVLAGPRDGAADPLELLVTGFVLGYLQRGGRY